MTKQIEAPSQERSGPSAVEELKPAQRRRRRRIVDAALDLVARRGGHVEMRDVAKHAHVALGTLYRYFGSKEVLFAEIYLRWCARHWDELAAIPFPARATRADRLRLLLRYSVEAFAAEPQFWELGNAVRSSLDPEVRECGRAIRDGVSAIYGKALEGIDDEDRHWILMSVLAVLYLSLTAWLAERMTLDEVHESLESTIRIALEFRDPALGD